MSVRNENEIREELKKLERRINEYVKLHTGGGEVPQIECEMTQRKVLKWVLCESEDMSEWI